MGRIVVLALALVLGGCTQQRAASTALAVARLVLEHCHPGDTPEACAGQIADAIEGCP
jgi:hypothetical protein